VSRFSQRLLCLFFFLFKIGLRGESHSPSGDAAFSCPFSTQLERDPTVSGQFSSTPSALRPSIRYAQNFLRDPRLVSALLDTCALDPDSLVYEIGPGEGIITAQLAQRRLRVIAIERDMRLAELLRRRFDDTSHVRIVEGDFLSHPLPRAQPYHVIGNIPFNITAAIVTRLTSAPCAPESAHLIMQREAAETLVGAPRVSLRALLLYPWFEGEIVRHLRRSDFTPAPRVDVVMLRLRKRGPPLISARDQRRYRDFGTSVFTAWHPTVTQSLRHLLSHRQLDHIQSTLDFDLTIKPTALSCVHWLELFTAFRSSADARAWSTIACSAQRHSRQQDRLEKIHRTKGAR
jgi:23S rRNA (adenine-N6)-dimethyltransferase